MDNSTIFLIKIKKDNEAFRDRGVYFLRLLGKNLTAKFVVSCCALCKLRRTFGFFPTIILADLLGTCLLVIGAFSSTFFVSMFQGSYRSVFFEDFSDRSYSCLSQEKNNVCLLPSTRMPLIIAISFAIPEQSKVILSFVFAGQAERARCIVICINPTHTQMIDGTEKPIRSLQTRRAIQRIRL